MDDIQVTSDVTTEAPSQGVGSGAESSAPAQTSEGQLSSVPAAQAYNPNYKYSVKGYEREFPEWTRALVKDEDTEKRFRDLVAKADGVDFLKGESETLKAENQQMMGVMNQVNGMLKSGDLPSFFEALNIPEEAVLKYALEVAQRRQDPQAQARYQQDRQAQSAQSQRDAQYQQLAEQNQSLQSQFQQMATQTRTMELNTVLSSPDVASVARSFDERMGKGAFHDEVVKRGIYYFHATGQDIPASQAAQEVMQLIGMQQPQQPQQLQQPFQAGNQGSKPVIPNIQGSGASPTRKVPKSIADLKAMAQAVNG